MQKWGGVVPEIASREHLKATPLAVEEACRQAGLKLEAIDWFTVSNRPGLIGALLVGVSYVKGLSFALKKPYTALNHIEAHLFSPLLGALEDTPPPPFPWIALVVSGGHTELFHVESALKYKWLGGTRDDAAGEAFDKIGKILGFPYPAGPQMDRTVREKSQPGDEMAFKFPRAETDAYSFSFSGLKTAVLLETRRQKELTPEVSVKLVASAQDAILDPLVTKLREAGKTLGVKNLVVTGGVACNSRLRALLPEAYFPKFKHCTDNAAMVAALSALYEKEGKLVASPLTETACATAQDF
jgi:N6-L-threonylcarbamoyladenine synthase